MRPAARLLLVSLGSLLLLAMTLAFVALDGVDYRPYFRQPYYQETLERLRVATATNTAARGPLSAGFGQASLTPRLGEPDEDPARGRFRSVPLAGYGKRQGRPATGVHDELRIKAVALSVGGRVGVFVGADALIIPREVAAAATLQLGQDPGLARHQIYFGATHTHASLGGWGEGFMAEAFAGDYQPGVRRWFAAQLVAAVREAMTDLRSATLGHGRFAAPEFVRNRLVGPLGRVDPDFSYLVVRQTAGRVAVVGSYAAHATVLSGDVMEFSGDYPGYWQRAVEQSTGGLALFLAGGVGSHSPVPGEGSFAGAERMGQTLARSVLDRLPGVALTNHIAFDFLGLELGLPELHVRIADGVRVRPWISRAWVPVESRSYLQAFRLNDLVWISTPCDFSGELALGIKDHLYSRGGHAVVTSFNGDYLGYLIPSRYYHLAGYEPRLMSFFGPHMADYVDELVRALAEDLAGS